MDRTPPKGCIGNCLACGKCGRFVILDGFSAYGQKPESRKGFGIAADIGTTSVVLALLDLTTGEVLARHSFMNPQRAFGPDVISRISAANTGHLEDMRCAITGSVVAGCQALLEAERIRPEQIVDMAVAGNTVMTYLLLGLPCESLGVFPFKPAYMLADAYSFAGVFGEAALPCPVHIMPWLAAFVGGDIMSGLLHVQGGGRGRFMLVDLGTNGEMALYDHGRLTVTSTASGPAFESVRSGVGASDVIGKLAWLMRNGHVDETGLLTNGAPDVFSQKEIRDLQLAKSATRSGQEILIMTAGVDYDALDTVYLAGGIGQAMSVADAATIGLLPAELSDKTCAVGNTSLAGAAQLLLAPKSAATRIEALRTAAVEVNLAEHPRFNDLFMEYMYFT